MKGRVDAIEEGRLYGWAFDPSYPTERLIIRVLLDDKPIAEAPADKDRPDLKRNGIGDGMHAFEVMLPQFAVARAGELVVVAANATGAEQKLRVPKPDEQAAEALIAAPMTRILDKLDMLMAAQRQLSEPTLAATSSPHHRQRWQRFIHRPARHCRFGRCPAHRSAPAHDRA